MDLAWVLCFPLFTLDFDWDSAAGFGFVLDLLFEKWNLHTSGSKYFQLYDTK